MYQVESLKFWPLFRWVAVLFFRHLSTCWYNPNITIKPLSGCAWGKKFLAANQNFSSSCCCRCSNLALSCPFNTGSFWRELLISIVLCVHFSRAKLLLRKKKFQEGLLQQTDSQLDQLERLVHDLEFALIEKQVRVFICPLYPGIDQTNEVKSENRFYKLEGFNLN